MGYQCSLFDSSDCLMFTGVLHSNMNFMFMVVTVSHSIDVRKPAAVSFTVKACPSSVNGVTC